jgi:hypothetical protein
MELAEAVLHVVFKQIPELCSYIIWQFISKVTCARSMMQLL